MSKIADGRRAELVKGLRDMATFIEKLDPAVPIDGSMEHTAYVAYDNIHGYDGVERKIGTPEGFAILANKVGGRLEKDGDVNYFRLQKWFGPAVKLEWFADREMVCERVKIGEKVIPAQAERVIPATAERVEEIYDFRCPSLIAHLPKPQVEEVNELALGMSPEAIKVLTGGDDDIPF